MPIPKLFLTLFAGMLLAANIAAMEAPALPPTLMTAVERPEDDGYEALGSLFYGDPVPPRNKRLKPIDATKLPFFMAAPIYFGLAESYRRQAETQPNAHEREKSQQKACSLYRAVANQGNPFMRKARAGMMDCYLHGQGVAVDYARALKEAQKLIDQSDDISAQWSGKLRLGQMLLLGQGVPHTIFNMRKGISLLQEVAHQTENKAAQDIACAYLACCNKIDPVLSKFENIAADLPDYIGDVKPLEATVLADATKIYDEIFNCTTVGELNERVQKLEQLAAIQAPMTAQMLAKLKFIMAARSTEHKLLQLSNELMMKNFQMIDEHHEIFMRRRPWLYPILGPSVVGLCGPKAFAWWSARVTPLALAAATLNIPFTFGFMLRLSGPVGEYLLSKLSFETLTCGFCDLINPMLRPVGAIYMHVNKLCNQFPDWHLGLNYSIEPLRLSREQIQPMVAELAAQDMVPFIKKEALEFQLDTYYFRDDIELLPMIVNYLQQASMTVRFKVVDWLFLPSVNNLLVLAQQHNQMSLLRIIFDEIFQLLQHEEMPLNQKIAARLKLSFFLFGEKSNVLYEDHIQRAVHELNLLLAIPGLHDFEYQPSLLPRTNAEISETWRKNIIEEFPALREEVNASDTILEAVTILREHIRQLIPNLPEQPAPAVEEETEKEREERQWREVHLRDQRRRRHEIQVRQWNDEGRIEHERALNNCPKNERESKANQ